LDINLIKRLFIILMLFCWVAMAPAQKIIMQPGAQIPMKIKPAQPKSEAQVIADRARRSEERGDYARALQTWKDLLSKSPWNYEAIAGIPRDLMVLKHYDDAEAFLNDLLRKNEFRDPRPAQLEDPTSTYSLTLVLGEVALAKGSRDKAWQIWNAALEQQGKRGNAVRMLVNMLQMSRLWEDSDQLIREYRKQSKDAVFMALESANALRAQMNFAASAEELLLFSRSTPAGWSIVINYLDRFSDDSSVTKKVTGVLDKALKTDRKNPDLWRIYAAYKLKSGELAKSLEATIAADSLSQGGGALVLASAQTMLKEGDIALAKRGFEHVLKWNPAPEIAERAELGLGECLETQGQWTQAKQAYVSFVEKHPKSRAVDEARVRIGGILLDHERKPDEALTVFKELWSRGAIPMRAMVGLRIGDCHAWLGDFSAAILSWLDVSKMSPQQPTEESAQALLRIARANFWRDSTSAAQSVLDNITEGNPTSTAFNDAVLYNALLDEGGVYAALRAFATGDLEIFKGEYASAANSFSNAAGLVKTGKVAEWCRFQQAMALRAAGKPTEAIAVLDTFIITYTNSVDLDRSVYLRTVIRQEDLNEDSGALEAFQKFLLEYPRSPYLEQARRRARILTARVS
jgi:outer membrane protein assembly factor BamD (BamD/ComL family)